MANVAMMGWDADAKTWRKVLVNAAGKLIIDPSEIFEDPPTDGEAGKSATSNWSHDHAADASAHHAKYTDAEARAAVGYNGTRYWSCPGNYFDGCVPCTDYITKSDSGHLLINISNIQTVASVFLPHGSVVTNILVKGNAAAASKIYYLKRIKISDRSTNEMAAAYINTADSSINFDAIDNSLYSYYIYTSALESDDEIWGAVITYTI